MDVSNFFTIIVPGPEQKIAGGANTSGSSVQSMPGLHFLEMILAQMNEDAEKISAPETSLLRPESKIPQADTTLTQALDLNRKAIDEALAPLTDGVITLESVEAGSPRLLKALMIENEGKSDAFTGRLNAILQQLKNIEKNPESGGLLLSNLTPEQIAELKTNAEILLNENAATVISEEDRKKALEGIYLGLINLLPPTAAQTNSAPLVMSSDIDSKINSLSSKGSSSSAPESIPGNPVDAESQDGDAFANMMKDFSGKKGNPQTGADITLKQPGVKPDLSTLENWNFNFDGGFFTPQGWTQNDSFAAPWQSLSVTGPASLTNLVTQGHTAALPHPATQAVAATITKAANSGETKNITLQLDPPELGRVEVRMSFGKGKDVKAVLLVEKPETLTMLQRDAHVLERALIDSGLDAGGSALDFALAQEGYDFNGNNRDGNTGGYAAADDNAEQIIQSTMTWFVDPETGHTRYDILA